MNNISKCLYNIHLLLLEFNLITKIVVFEFLHVGHIDFNLHPIQEVKLNAPLIPSIIIFTLITARISPMILLINFSISMTRNLVT